MRNFTLILLLCFFTLNYSQAQIPAKLIFIDNFDGSNLNTKVWDYRQLNTYRLNSWVTTNAVKVENGNLKLLAYSEADGEGFKHYSGMISTQNSFNQKFGYFEARIKFSTVAGMWSAFWVQSPTVTADMPAEQAGVEIDIMEHRAIDIKGDSIPDMVAQTLHWGGYGPKHEQKKYRQDNMSIGAEYHIYAVEWTEDKYTFYYDGKPTVTWTRTDNVPVSQVAQYIIFTTEVWDNNWAGKIPTTGFGSQETSNAYMLVDWVKVYDKKPL